MSFSKCVRRCDRCACRLYAVRFIHTHNRLTTHPVDVHPHNDKMSTAPHWRSFSLSQWRHFRDQLLKLQSDGMFLLNKEWSNLLQKLPPLTSKQDVLRIKRFHPYSSETKDSKINNEQSVKGSGEVKSASVSSTIPLPKSDPTVSATSSPAAVPPQVAAPLAAEEAGINYLQLLSELNWRLTFGISKVDEGPKAAVKAKWRTHEESITKSSINSRTRHVISAVISASGRDSKIKRLEGFLQHLYQYPESRSCAVKEGAVTVLLRQRQSTKDNEILAHVREALSLLGYADPPGGHGIRILSIDGGGIRGVLAIKLMMKLEELTGKPIYELFDYVCGVSTGAILACSIFPHKRRLDEVLENYKELSKQVFDENVLSGTRRLMWYHAYYDTTKWEDMLQKFIGSTKFIHTSRDALCPKMSAVSTVVNKERSSAFVFRNYELRHSIQSQYVGSSEHLLWEAVRASSSAPTYFREFQLGHLLHQDGGIMANNPCGIAIHEARLLWPGAPLQCVVSFGTGRCNPTSAKCEQEPPVPSTSSWSNKVSKILDSATDTEAVHTLLNDLMPGNKYYRFNPYLTEMLGMSEIRADKLSQLEMDAEMYYRRNEEKFQEAAKALLEPRTTTQRLGDWLSLQANMLGLKANL